MKTLELTQYLWLKAVLRSRWPQLALRLVTLAGFGLAIAAGLAGTPVGSRNFAIVFVWIAWWALLILAIVPFFGRGWCTICPIPMPGEWLQQGALLEPNGKGRGLGWRWPNRFRNIWLQNGGFAMVALFSTIILTQPVVSAAVLAVFLVLSTVTGLLYERRAFCRYLCPVGGFIGLYAQAAPVELRVKDTSVCAAHTEKTCYTGSAAGYGCPWQVFPPGLVKNTYCGTCLECLRTCPHDNIAINLRPFGTDLHEARGRKLDEAFKAFLMLGSALVYSAVMLGPWGGLKATAYAVGSLPWLGYAAGFLGLVFGVVPGLFWLAVQTGRRLSGLKTPVRTAFIQLAYALVPLGLMAWVAFSLSFVLANSSYIWPSLSDPFGWGWDLFGSAQAPWTPYLSGQTPLLQVGVLLTGLIWASRTVRRTSAGLISGPKVGRLALPVVLYCLAVTAALFVLLIA